MKKYLSREMIAKIGLLIVGVVLTFIMFSAFVHNSIASYLFPEFLVIKEPDSRYINSVGADPIIGGVFNIIVSIFLFVVSLNMIQSRFYGSIIALIFSSFFTILTFSIIYYRLADGILIDQKLDDHYDSFYLSFDVFFNSNISGIQIDKFLRPIAAFEMLLGFLYLGTLISYVFLIYTSDVGGRDTKIKSNDQVKTNSPVKKSAVKK